MIREWYWLEDVEIQTENLKYTKQDIWLRLMSLEKLSISPVFKAGQRKQRPLFSVLGLMRRFRALTTLGNLEQVLAFLEQHLNEPVTLDDLLFLLTTFAQNALDGHIFCLLI